MSLKGVFVTRPESFATQCISTGTSFQFDVDSRDYTFVFSPKNSYNKTVLADPETFQATDEDSFTRRFPAGTSPRRLGAALLSLNGMTHLHQRAFVSRAMSLSRNDSRLSAMHILTSKTVAQWPTDEAVDLLPIVRQLVRELTANASLGIDLNGHRGRRIMALLDAFASPLSSSPDSLQDQPYFTQVADELEQTLELLIEDVRCVANRHESVTASMVGEMNSHKETARTVACHLVTLYISGYQSTASALAWALFLIAQHPDIAHELAGGATEMQADRRSRKYSTLLTGVINESLRLFPPALWGKRIVCQSVLLESYTAAPKSVVVFSPFVTHRLKRIFRSQNASFPIVGVTALSHPLNTCLSELAVIHVSERGL